MIEPIDISVPDEDGRSLYVTVRDPAETRAKKKSSTFTIQAKKSVPVKRVAEQLERLIKGVPTHQKR